MESQAQASLSRARRNMIGANVYTFSHEAIIAGACATGLLVGKLISSKLIEPSR